ncbi:MAG: cytochrome c3 family protein [Aggregatilineales bacterium]|nr:cytochrome c3 family protein [Chloroflexota bacterium]HOA25631.1 cytochrome c3 family protein [Aggregatilineales bacterium]HPV06409.1 cytochrome c3 family protein [Aggregatilineales bacterium]HQE18372.1 cytochrome c3 family protein [Aggregatilineales bacterium]
MNKVRYDHLLPILLLLFLTGCQTAFAVESTPTPTPTVTPLPSPTPNPADVVAHIEATWRDIDSLARPHLEEGIECEACHLEGVLAAERPSNATCLDCHQTTISELYAITNSNGTQVHPAAHLETEDCSTCHRGHKHIADPCNSCH